MISATLLVFCEYIRFEFDVNTKLCQGFISAESEKDEMVLQISTRSQITMYAHCCVNQVYIISNQKLHNMQRPIARSVGHYSAQKVGSRRRVRTTQRCRVAHPQSQYDTPLKDDTKSFLRMAVTGVASLVLCVSGASANDNLLAEFKTSGVIFKDTIQVLRLQDPEVQGVAIYYTDYTRSITEKLTSSEDAFSDPSQSSISCSIESNAAIVKDPSAIRGSEGKEIFAEMKGLNILQNKKTRIRRVYDEKNQNVLYVAYNTRNTRSKDEGGVSSSRYRTSMCSVHVQLATD